MSAELAEAALPEENLPPPLLFAAREARLAALDALPRALWLGGLINAEGRVEPRLRALRAWIEQLPRGRLAEGAAWPAPALAETIESTLRTLRLEAYCQDKPELARQVLSSLLWHLDHVVDYQDRGCRRDDAVARALADFADDWSERCGVVDELTEVFGELGDFPRDTLWGDMAGLLKSEAWQEVVRIRRLLERLPELARLIRRLGRARASEDEETAEAPERTVNEPTLAPVCLARPVRVPDLPGETRGIRRSGRFARMLPVESVLLLHPKLRLVWHARHAERALLTYEDDDRQDAISHDTQWSPRLATRRQRERRRELGPMLICIDTSGSMQGGAEAVAKACALEAARTAHAQGRDCLLFAFGGPGEVVETSLRLDARGIRALTEFLGQGFRGGTDICGPIERAVERLGEARWRQADLVIASDGDFGATPAVAAALTAMKNTLGVRVQGVLIGDRETIGLLELADDIFWVRDWRRYGGADGARAESPVHSKSLTADYFPGALRGPGLAPPTYHAADGARALWPTTASTPGSSPASPPAPTPALTPSAEPTATPAPKPAKQP